jgi:hypothetical protein
VASGARLLLDGQGVEPGPHRDGLPGGSVLPLAGLRTHMQPLAQFESSRKLIFQGLEEHPEKVNRPADIVLRPLSARHHASPPFLQASDRRFQVSAKYL